MKVFAIIFVVFLTGADCQISRSVADRVLQRVSDNITDPLLIPDFSYNLSLPVTDLVKFRLDFGGIEVAGASNMELTQFRYRTLPRPRVTFELLLNNITVTVNQSEVQVKVLNLNLNGTINGSVAIVGTRVSGTVDITIGISNVTVRNADLDFKAGNVTSNLNVVVQNQDISDKVNNFLDTTLVTSLDNNRDEINKALEYIVMQVAGAS